MKSFYLGLKFSFSYFSILPVSFKDSDDLSSKEILSVMVLSLPFVGAVLGLITVAIYIFLLKDLGLYGAIVSAVIYMFLYGFLHTEAVLDVGDAIYASHSGKDAYKIIKEPIVGAMGVLYAFALVLLKVAGVSYMLLNSLFIEFITVLVVSRLSLVILFNIHKFRSSFATQLKESISKRDYILSLIFFISLLTIIDYSLTLIILFGILFSIAISFWIKRKIGFVNGDVLGATLEIVETILFLLIAKLF